MGAATFQPSTILAGFNWPPYNMGMFWELHIEDQHLVAHHLEEKASHQISSVRDSSMSDYDKQVNLENLEKLWRMHREAERRIRPLVAVQQARQETERLRWEVRARQEVSDAVKALKVAAEKRKKRKTDGDFILSSFLLVFAHPVLEKSCLYTMCSFYSFLSTCLI